MTRLERFNKRLTEISTKFNNNIVLVDDIEYAKVKDNLKWYCKEHDITFETSIHNLTDERRVHCCPLCFEKERLNQMINNFEAKFNTTFIRGVK